MCNDKSQVITKEKTYEIARNVEYDIINRAKAVFTYRFLITQKVNFNLYSTINSL